jgi:hypothetical protein
MDNALFVAWYSPHQRQWGPVGKLERTPTGYRFFYTRGAKTLAGFRPFPGMEDLDTVYESDELFPLFANRLLAPSRPEYEAFLRWGGFDPHHPPDPIAVLGVTEGRRVTDTVEVFPCPTPDAEGRYVTKFFLHGLRWMAPAAWARVLELKPEEPLALMLDFMNRYDPYAVAVRTCDELGRMLLGYVPRYLARDIRQVCLRCAPDFISVTVERVNPDAPLRQRLLCRFSACWPPGFQPCQGEEFQPLTDLPQLTPANCEAALSTARAG